jgi:hypothetical protein
MFRSGSRMRLYGKSKSCGDFTYRTERITTSLSYFQDRNSDADDTRYNKMCGSLRSLIHKLSLLPAEDPFRQAKEAEMLNKLYDMGILGQFWRSHEDNQTYLM